MKIAGVKIIGVLVAAIVAYAIGALYYGLIFADLWKKLTGVTEASMKGEMWRMSLSWIMPLVISFAIAKRNNALNIQSLVSSAKSGFAIGLLLTLGARLYTFVYSAEPLELFILDGIHLVIISTAIGIVHSIMKTASE